MKNLMGVLVLGGVLAVSVPAWSISMTVAQVGATDTLLAKAHLANSGEATEESWVESVLGFDVTMTYKLESSGTWYSVQGVANTFALALKTAPDYFLLKTGNLNSVSGGSNPSTHFLFTNLGELSWAVVNFTNMGYLPTVCKVTKVSHIDEFTGNRKVPEPGTFLLIGSGLLGIGLLRRKKNVA